MIDLPTLDRDAVDLEILDQIFSGDPPPEIRAWCAENVDFSRAAGYPTDFRIPFNPELNPVYEEPCRLLLDDEVDEIGILKATGVGATEELILNPMRYFVYWEPSPMMYIGAQQEDVEAFFDMSIVKGFDLAEALDDKVARSSTKGGVMRFDDCHVMARHCRSRSAKKSFTVAKLFLDEVSVFSGLDLEMFKNRMRMERGKIVIMSAMDPEQKVKTKNDTMWVFYHNGDQREYLLPDPAKKGTFFRPFFGGREEKEGVKWSRAALMEGGKWNKQGVLDSVRYVTPGGAELNNDEFKALIPGGHWKAMNPTAESRIPTFRIPRYVSRLKKCGLGDIAWSFLDAKMKGMESKMQEAQALRVWCYEVEVKEYTFKVQSANEDVLRATELDYELGEPFAESEGFKSFYIPEKMIRLFGTDVQKGHFWWGCREFIEGARVEKPGDLLSISGLVDWGYAGAWRQLNDLADKYACHQWFCDTNYRRTEVYELASPMKLVPVSSNEKLGVDLRKLLIDPFEGKARQGSDSLITTYSFNTTTWKDMLFDMITGASANKWHIPRRFRDFEDRRVYAAQVLSEEKRDGLWQPKSAGRDNHLWDVEVILLVGAWVNRILRTAFVSEDVEAES